MTSTCRYEWAGKSYEFTIDEEAVDRWKDQRVNLDATGLTSLILDFSHVDMGTGKRIYTARAPQLWKLPASRGKLRSKP